MQGKGKSFSKNVNPAIIFSGEKYPIQGMHLISFFPNFAFGKALQVSMPTKN